MTKRINSREKGKRNERECAAIWSELGYPCIRGQQYSGIGGKDVVGPEGAHIEVKSYKSQMRFREWWEQAERDAGDELPILCHKRNNDLWFVTVHLSRLNELIQLLSHYETQLKALEDKHAADAEEPSDRL